MSEMLEMVFAAFMQHCIRSTVNHLTHVEDVKDAIVLCIQWTLAPPGGKDIYLGLLSCGFSGSPPVSLRRQLCYLSWT